MTMTTIFENVHMLETRVAELEVNKAKAMSKNDQNNGSRGRAISDMYEHKDKKKTFLGFNFLKKIMNLI
jgi:hypothetical protein